MVFAICVCSHQLHQELGIRLFRGPGILDRSVSVYDLVAQTTSSRNGSRTQSGTITSRPHRSKDLQRFTVQIRRGKSRAEFSTAFRVSSGKNNCSRGTYAVKPLLADELDSSSCQIVHRAGDLDVSFRFQLLQNWTASANLGENQ